MDIVKSKKKKFRKILLISGLSTVIFVIALGVILGYVGYQRAKNGKKPIFVYHTVNVSTFDVEIAGFDDIDISYPESAKYYGFGYNVTVCDDNYTFNLGNKQEKACSDSLYCEKKLDDNDTYTITYDFIIDKLERISISKVIPAKQLKNVKSYEKEILKINEIPGCNARFSKVDENTYATTEVCALSKMTDEDIETVYQKSRKSLLQTKNEIKRDSEDQDMKCHY